MAERPHQNRHRAVDPPGGRWVRSPYPPPSVRRAQHATISLDVDREQLLRPPTAQRPAAVRANREPHHHRPAARLAPSGRRGAAGGARSGSAGPRAPQGRRPLGENVAQSVRWSFAVRFRRPGRLRRNAFAPGGRRVRRGSLPGRHFLPTRAVVAARVGRVPAFLRDLVHFGRFDSA